MLSKFRTHHIRAIFWGLVLLVVPSFVLWGVASYLRSQRENTYLYLGKERISYTKFRDYVTTATIYYRLIFPRREDFYKNVNQQVIRSKAFQLILLLWKAKQDKIKVSDAELARYIERSFSRNGKFDKKFYYQFVTYNFPALNMTPEIFERHLRRILVSEKVEDKYIRNVKVTDEEVKQLYKEENEKAKISYIFLDINSVLEDIKIDDKEVVDFYNNNKERFRTAPSVKIKYIVLNADKDRKILTRIKKLIPRLKNIDKIAQKLSLEVKESPYLKRDTVLEGIGGDEAKINDLAFSLKEGEISPLIDLGNKYIVFEKIDTKEGDILPFSEVKEKIINNLKHKKAKEKLLEVSKEIIKEIDSNYNRWEEVAKDYNLEVKKSNYFSRFQVIEGIGYEDAIVKAAFRMKKGEVSKTPFVTDKGIYIIRLDDFIPFDEKEFEKKKEEYSRRIKQQKIFLKSMQFFNELQKETNLRIVSSTPLQ